MEMTQTTKKGLFSKKAISVLLVLVMLMNLFPTMAFAAPVKSGDGTVDTLAQAINNAVTYGSIGDFSVSGTTVTDTSKNNSIWTIAVLLRDVYQNSYTSTGTKEYWNPNQFYSWLTGQLSAKGVNTGNTDVQKLLKALVGYGGFTYYGPSNKTTSDSKDRISAQSITVTVKRSATVALLDYNWDSLNSLPNSVDTAFNYKISSTSEFTSSYEKEEGSGCNKENVTYYTGQYCRISGISGYNKTESADTKDAVANLKAYVELCNTLDPANLPTFESLYNNNSAEQLMSLYQVANAANNAVKNVDADLFNYWITVSVGNISPSAYWTDTAQLADALAAAAAMQTAVDAYIVNCSDAYFVKTYEDDVAALNALITNGYDTNDRDAMVDAQTKAAAYYKTISEDVPADKLPLLVQYAHFDQARAEAFLTDVFDDINKYDIRDIKAAVDRAIDETSGALKYAEDSTEYTEYGLVYDLRAPETEKLQSALEKITALKAVLDNTKDTFTKDYTGYVGTIFNGDRYDNTYIADINWELAFREVEAGKSGIYDYFASALKVKSSAFSANYYYLLKDANEKFAEVKSLINEYKATLGDEAVNDLFPPIYAESGTFVQEIEAYIAELYANAGTTLDIEIKEVMQLLELSDGQIGLDNYALFESYYNSIQKLYGYLESSNPAALSEYVKNNKATVDGFLAGYNSFMESWSFGDLQQKDLSGSYPVRPGSDTDYARHAGEDFAVTKNNLLNTVNNFDSVLSSDLLMKLLGEEDMGADLKSFVRAKLGEMLFSDDMVNKVFAMLYPTVTELLDGLVETLITGIAGDSSSAVKKLADGGLELNLTELTKNSDTKLSGTAVLYIDEAKYQGSKGTYPDANFVDIFEDAGLNIYPVSLAKLFRGDPILGGAFDGMGRSWDKYKEGDEVVFNFDWGLDDESLTAEARYNTFCNALGKIFEPIKPIIGTLFGTSAFSRTINDAAFVKVNAGYTYKIIREHTLDIDVAATAGLKLDISPINGYNTLWIPLLEALGLNAPDAPYSFDPITGSESTADMVGKLFGPVLALIDQIADSPIENVLSILPNLAYIVSFDGINNLIDEQKLTIGYSIAGLDVISSESGGAIEVLTTLGDLLGTNFLDGILAGIINLILKPKDMNVGEILDIGSLLGCDMSDINSVVRMLFDAIGFKGLDVPIIDPAQLITCGTPMAGVASARLSGTRNFIQADKADVFFVLFNWILDSLSNQSLINGVLAALSDNAPELSETTVTLLNALARNKDKALLAIVELMNPQEYELAELECFNDDAYGQYVEDKEIEGFNAASAVYLNNDTNWTKEKAEYVVNNVESVLEALLTIAGADKEDIEELLSGAKETVFTNEIITYVVRMLCDLGGDIDLGEELMNILTTELGFDLHAWLNAFGYLFDEDSSTNVKGGGFPALSYVKDEETGEFAWKFNETLMKDGDEDAFVTILTYLFADLKPLIGLLLNDQDFTMLANDAITVKGYDGYANAILPLFKALNIPALSDENYQFTYSDDQLAGLKYIIDSVFTKLDDIAAAPASELVTMLPDLIYFLEGNGLSVVLRNLLQPVLVLVDTVKPLVSGLAILGDEPIDLDIDALVKGMVADLLGDDGLIKPEYLDALTMKDLRLEDLLGVADQIAKGKLGSEFELLPVLSPALRTFSMTAEGLDPADGITVILSALLELLEYGDNAMLLDKYLIDEDILPRKTGGILSALTAIFDAPVTDMLQPDWAYTFRLAAAAAGEEYPYADDTDYFEVISNNESGALDLTPFHTINYLNYEGSDWNYETAQYLSDNLDEIVLEVLKAVIPDADPDADSIDDIITALNIYSAETVDKVASLLKELLGELVVVNEKGEKNTAILDVLGKIIDGNITALLDFDASSYFVSGDEESDRDSFVRAISDMLAPAAPLLDLLFLGKDIEYFDASGIVNSRKAILTLHGAEGYAYGLVPLIEALGGSCKSIDEYYTKVYDLETGTATCTPKSAGSSVKMLQDVLNQACDILDKLMADPADTALSMLPNLLYFINSNGLTAAVNNTLRGVSDIADTVLDTMGGIELSDGTVVKSLNDIVKAMAGIDLSDLSVDQLIALIKDMTTEYAEDGSVRSVGLDLSPISELIKTFFIGKMEYFESANGEGAFRMVYNDEEDRADMLTILISFVIETIKFDKDVAAYLDELLGTDGMISKALECYKGYEVNYLSFEMQNIDWYATEYADDPEYVFNLIETTKQFDHQYGPLFTEAMANDIGENFDEFLDTTISLLGVQIDGQNVNSLPELINALIGTTVYTQDNILKLLDTIAEIMNQLNALPAAEHIKAVLRQTLGIDLTIYDKYLADPTLLTGFTDGDRDGFVASVKLLLNPVYPVLNWLLCNEDISFFVDRENKELVKLYGAEGYKYGIIPVLEALMCENVLTTEEYYAAIENDPDAIFDSILDPLLNKLDEILADPANEIFDLLPNIIYFVNSNGLDTCWKNILHAVYGLLNELKPVVDVDLYALLGIRLDEMTFDALSAFLFDLIAEKTGYELNALVMDEIAELTTGQLVSFESANGETAYRMIHCANSKAQMATALMRIAVKFVACENNADMLKDMMKNNENVSEEAYKFYCAFIDLACGYAQSSSGIDTLLYVSYYAYYGVKTGVIASDSWLKDFNTRYETIYNLLVNDKTPVLQEIAKFLKDKLGLEDIVDDGGLAPNGLIKFFTSAIEKVKSAISNVIKSITNLFKR